MPDTHANGPNKGINVREYGLAILITVVVVLIAGLIFLKTHKNAMAPSVNPKPTSAASPQ